MVSMNGSTASASSSSGAQLDSSSCFIFRYRGWPCAFSFATPRWKIAGGAVRLSVHGLAALLGAIAISVELWRFGNFADAEDCFGPKIGNGTDWFDLFRAAAWIVAFVILVSDLLGYAAFGSFLVAQFFWAGLVRL